MRVKIVDYLDESLTDSRIENLIIECINTLKKTEFAKYFYDGDLSFDEFTSWETLGNLCSNYLVKDPYFILSLNSRIFNDSDEAIKNVIYHELCHFIVNKKAIDMGDYFFDEEENCWVCFEDKKIKPHGKDFKDIANKVSKIVGQDINTKEYDTEKNFPIYYKNKILNLKYVLKCSRCGKLIAFPSNNDSIKAAKNLLLSHKGCGGRFILIKP